MPGCGFQVPKFFRSEHCPEWQHNSFSVHIHEPDCTQYWSKSALRAHVTTRSSFKEEIKRSCRKELAKPSTNRREMPELVDNREGTISSRGDSALAGRKMLPLSLSTVARELNHSPLGSGNAGSKHIYSTFLSLPQSPLKRLLILELHIQPLKQLYTHQAWGFILRQTTDASEWLLLGTTRLVINSSG